MGFGLVWGRYSRNGGGPWVVRLPGFVMVCVGSVSSGSHSLSPSTSSDYYGLLLSKGFTPNSSVGIWLYG